MKRLARGDLPKKPPRPYLKEPLPFPVSEDPEHPVGERLTGNLVIQVKTDPFPATDIVLIRRAIWSIHPRFDIRYRTQCSWSIGDASPTADAVEQLNIEVPASKIASPTMWLRTIIDDFLPIVHGAFTVHWVRFGGEPYPWSRGY